MFRGEPQQNNEALRYFSVAEALCPSSPGVHHNLSAVLSALGKLEEAIFESREAMRYGSDLASPHFNMGNTLCRLMKYEEAIVEFRECLRLRPDNAEAHTNLGSAFSALRRFDEAILEAREAIRLKPDAENAHSNLCGSWQRKIAGWCNRSQTRSRRKRRTENRFVA